MRKSVKIAIIGLGYVGLPLAVAFAEKYEVIGFDIDSKRIKELKEGIDSTGEIDQLTLGNNNRLIFSNDPKVISSATIFIITVPTPITIDKKPDLQYLIHASTIVGKVLKKGDIVIYESTVYPGCTEEECIPCLEKVSGLKYNLDFFCGYSPERINPGDKVNTLTKIIKITSGSNRETAKKVDELYKSIIVAGTYLAPSIKVAEAAKAIENAQRDVNISFMNEIALIFDRMGIDTHDVLEAASTKWNFLSFKPGLVGGHCIGVDPHYLAYKAMELGYQPKVILSGREVNDQMGFFVAEKAIALLAAKKNGKIKGLRALLLGIAFKENCSDIRNTKVTDIYKVLTAAGIKTEIFDPLVNQKEVLDKHRIVLVNEPGFFYDIIILAVAHKEFQTFDFMKYKLAGSIIVDTKGVIKKEWVDFRL